MFNRLRLFVKNTNKKVLYNKQKFSTTTVDTMTVEKYPLGMQLMHWTMGGAMLGCVAFVQLAKNSKDKKFKGDMMFYHKSCGTLAFGLLFPRLLLRVTSKIPAPIADVQWQQIGAKLGHYLMLSFAIVLPSTGVAMGYFGGKGLPFFYTTLPGADEANRRGDIAKNAFKIHGYAGLALEYMLFFHVGAAGFHLLKGHPILARIVPGLK
mmetsp:Transcript_73592/g.204509  ORF Transcript_73592/g.204509 Transcript_73592/m.204509 type:complete len:208 (+) Transcript_73592:33-656(+)